MKRVRAAAGLVVGSFAGLHYLGRRWGSTTSERASPQPGDEIVPAVTLVANHAITIDAPASDIWPWLVQMGWHQGGWYTSPWVDRLLFPANSPATEHIMPELQDHRVADFVPDGPPESLCGFVIERLQPQRCLVLHSTTHLPLSLRKTGRAQLDWSWSFALDDLGGDRTRFLFQSRATAGPWWVLAAYHAFIVPADFIMSRQMLRGVKRRAERHRRTRMAVAGT